MIDVISYSSSEYYENLQNRLIRDLRKYDMRSDAYTLRWLQNSQFYTDNVDLLSATRGAGFWAWKPYLILDALSTLAENDIVCYCDASTTLREDPTSAILSVKNILVCDSSWVNRNWIKRDCFILMGCDEPMYYDATQVWAGTVIVRNTKVSKAFVSEWLLYCLDRRIISDDPSVLGENLPEFRDHRHDQAVLTLLVTKYMKKYPTPGVETRIVLPFIDE